MRWNDPIYLAKSVHHNELIDKPIWKYLRRYLNNTNKIKRLLNASKTKQRSNTANVKFGINTPRENKDATMFDTDNGNTNWKDDELL